VLRWRVRSNKRSKYARRRLFRASKVPDRTEVADIIAALTDLK
jgi:hypothetical protein